MRQQHALQPIDRKAAKAQAAQPRIEPTILTENRNQTKNGDNNGKIKGAPISLITAARPQNCARASARASGTADKVDKSAESAACKMVKRKADQSAGPKLVGPSA